MHKVPFVSQRKYVYSGSCGVASTMMLLRFHYRRKRLPSFRTLRTELAASYSSDPRQGVDLPDVTRYLRRQRVPFRATHKKSASQLKVLFRRVRKAPAMVGMGRNRWRWGNSGHWIVLVAVDRERVIFLDPQYPPAHRRPCSLPLPKFRHQWDGSSVQIVGFR